MGSEGRLESQHLAQASLLPRLKLGSTVLILQGCVMHINEEHQAKQAIRESFEMSAFTGNCVGVHFLCLQNFHTRENGQSTLRTLSI